MAKKKPLTTKLDATVQATHAGPRYKESLPERKRSTGAFRRAYMSGAIATLWVRRFNEKKAAWYLEKIECMLLQESVNCFYYEDENGQRKSKPWWAVYDFNIEGEEGSGEADELDGDAELPDEQGLGDTGEYAGEGERGPDRGSQEPADI